MKPVIYLPYMYRGHMGVDLRGGDVCVAQQAWDAHDVGPILKLVGGKAMTQRMRGDRLRETDLLGIALGQLPKALTGHWHTTVADEHVGLALCFLNRMVLGAPR
jgi:hypothetical protein